MLEIRFHGRGGQGAVVASEMLAQAAFLEGKFPQSFPFIGVERRGAPVTAFCRIDEMPVMMRTGITTPDAVVVLDAGLMNTISVTQGLKPGGILLINTEVKPKDVWVSRIGRVATVDARTIAIENGLGSRAVPIVNTAVLGALAKATGVVKLDSLLEAIRRYSPAKPQENMQAARQAYDRVVVEKELLA